MTIYAHIPSLHTNMRGEKPSTVLGRSVRALWPKGSHVYLQGLTLITETLDASYFRFELAIHSHHDKGVFVSGGRWFAVVHRSRDIDVELSFIPFRHEADKKASMPYRPSKLPPVLFQMTPEGNDADDPFGGAANWIPFQ